MKIANKSQIEKAIDISMVCIKLMYANAPETNTWKTTMT